MTGFRLYLLSCYITYTIFPMRESCKKNMVFAPNPSQPVTDRAVKCPRQPVPGAAAGSPLRPFSPQRALASRHNHCKEIGASRGLLGVKLNQGTGTARRGTRRPTRRSQRATVLATEPTAFTVAFRDLFE